MKRLLFLSFMVTSSCGTSCQTACEAPQPKCTQQSCPSADSKVVVIDQTKTIKQTVRIEGKSCTITGTKLNCPNGSTIDLKPVVGPTGASGKDGVSCSIKGDTITCGSNSIQIKHGVDGKNASIFTKVKLTSPVTTIGSISIKGCYDVYDSGAKICSNLTAGHRCWVGNKDVSVQNGYVYVVTYN